MKAIDDFESFGRGQADFRITTNINGSSSSRKFNDHDDVFANFDTVCNVSTYQRFILFSISVIEEDGRFNSDDRVDINPNTNRNLSLTYDTLTGRITGEGLFRQQGDLITLEGRNRGERARIQFPVNYQAFV